MQYITEQQIDEIANETCKALAAEKKVAITISPENGRPFWEGGINGHFFRIRTETRVEVPESLAKVIAETDRVRVESLKAVKAYQSGGKRLA